MFNRLVNVKALSGFEPSETDVALSAIRRSDIFHSLMHHCMVLKVVLVPRLSIVELGSTMVLAAHYEANGAFHRCVDKYIRLIYN